MTIETVPFDAAEHLGGEAAQIELLDDAFASGDAGCIAEALGVVARGIRLTVAPKNAA